MRDQRRGTRVNKVMRRERRMDIKGKEDCPHEEGGGSRTEGAQRGGRQTAGGRRHLTAKKQELQLYLTSSIPILIPVPVVGSLMASVSPSPSAFRVGSRSPMIAGGMPVTELVAAQRPPIWKQEGNYGTARVHLPKLNTKYPETKHTVKCAALTRLSRV